MLGSDACNHMKYVNTSQQKVFISIEEKQHFQRASYVETYRPAARKQYHISLKEFLSHAPV